MRVFSLGEDTKKVQWSSRTLGLNMIPTFSACIVWGIIILAISIGPGCSNSAYGGNSGGSTSGCNSDANTASGVQGQIDPKWPSDKLPKSVPPIAGAKVLTSMQDGDDFGVVFMCKKRTITAYIQHLQQIGWNIDKDMGSDGNDELGAISHFLSNDDGEQLQVSWQSGGGTGTLGYSKM